MARVFWSLLLLVWAQSVALAQPTLPSDACAAVFAAVAESSRPFLHVQKSSLSAQALLDAGRFQEAMWVAEESGQKKLAAEIHQTVTQVLMNEEPTEMKPIGEGVSRGLFVTFKNGLKAVFKDTNVAYVKHEVAAYLLDRELSLNLVPLTVYRNKGMHGTLQVFVPQTTKRKDWGGLDPQYVQGVEPQRLKLLGMFDRLLGNNDRHGWNMLVTQDTRRIIAIDHGHTIWNDYNSRQIGIPDEIDDPVFHERLFSLKPERIEKLLEPWVDKQLIQRVIQRREQLLKSFESRPKQSRENAA